MRAARSNAFCRRTGYAWSTAQIAPNFLPLFFQSYRFRGRDFSPQSLGIKGDLRALGVDPYGVVEVRLTGLGFPLNLPHSRIHHVIRLLFEWGDKSRAEPLHAIVGLRGEVAIVECDNVGALVAAVPGFLRVFVIVP